MVELIKMLIGIAAILWIAGMMITFICLSLRVTMGKSYMPSRGLLNLKSVIVFLVIIILWPISLAILKYKLKSNF